MLFAAARTMLSWLRPRANPQHFRQLAESIPQIVWTAEPNGNLDWFNERWFKYTGLTLSETKDWGWQSALHPDDLPKCIEAWTRSFTTFVPYEIEYRLRNSQGIYHWHLGRATPLRNARGKVIKWFGTCTDIHDQKQARIEAIEAKRRVDVIIAHTDAIITCVDMNGVFTFVEGRGVGSVGLKREDRLGKSIYELHKDRPGFIKLFERGLAGEDAQGMLRLGPSWLDLHVTPIKSEDGKIIGVTGITFNVTQRIQSEQALLESRKKLETVLKHAPVAFWELDKDRKITMREGIGVPSLGLTAEQMVGLDARELYKDIPNALDFIERAFAGETYEGHNETGGRKYWFFITPVYDESGEINGVTGLTKDITDEHKAEQERHRAELREKIAVESSQLKTEFVAKMSHEIRTPLNAILGFTDLTLDTKLSAKQRENLRHVKQSGDFLLRIINDVLDFSKIEAGKVELENIGFDLRVVVDEIQQMLTFSAKDKNVGFLTHMQEQGQWLVRGDPTRIKQVLMNVVGNAIKFTSRGQVTLNVAILAEHPSETHVRFSVRDTGIGMTLDEQTRIFEAFLQSDASTTRRFGGSGLGLWISKQLVELMGGRLLVESQPGQGSRFWFDLVMPNADVVTANVPPISYQTGHSARIWVAEDNHLNRVVVVHTLKKLGYQPSVFESGKLLLDALQNAACDLILMDCQMNEMDGYEATERIRQNHARRDVPIIAMTANRSPDDRDRCLRAGMNDYISKPISRAELAGVLARWIPNE